MSPTLSSLYIYPIKSCAGTALRESGVGQAGLDGDRRWMLVDAAGRFMTQRQWPAMALVRPELDGDLLRVQASGMPVLEIPRAPAPAAAAMQVQVWNDITDGVDQGDAAARWFSDVLGAECRLVGLHPQARRHASLDYVRAWTARHGALAPGLGERHLFGFADGFPLLVIGQSSLDDLNRRLGEGGHAPVGMERFRPNIVVAGLEPHDEDQIALLRAGEVAMPLVKPCARCAIPNIDPATGRSAEQPGRTLIAYRGTTAGVLFGQNGLVQAPPGSVLRVGDALEVEWAF